MTCPESIELNSEQEKIFGNYNKKWREIAFSTERINRNKAAAAIKARYHFINEQAPEILFFDSPYTASIELDDGLKELKNEDLLATLFRKGLLNDFDSILWEKIDKMRELVFFDMDDKLDKNEGVFCDSCFEPGNWQIDYCCSYAAFNDFYFNEHHDMNYSINLEAWNITQNILINCGSIAAGEELCLICDRPTQLFFDEQNLLHAEGKPAIEYADGYKLYAHHGIQLSEKSNEVNFDS